MNRDQFMSTALLDWVANGREAGREGTRRHAQRLMGLTNAAEKIGGVPSRSSMMQMAGLCKVMEKRISLTIADSLLAR